MSSNFNLFKSVIAAALAGILFGAGLAVSEMMNPKKVLGFLDFAGDWDPSLGFVMGIAVVIAYIGYRYERQHSRPLFDDAFHLPKRTDITPRLMMGSALFGIGWGVAGLCPGPAITALLTVEPDFIIFTLAMLGGIVAHIALERLTT